MATTVRQLHEQLVEKLNLAGLAFGHGTASAEDEALWMIAHVQTHGVNSALRASADLNTLAWFEQFTPERWDDALPDAETAELKDLLKKRISTRKPLAYLLGEAYFCGLRFKVTESVLVPRSPIAELIMSGFEPWLKPEPGPVLDLCTGSGCIALAIAHWIKPAAVDAVDIDSRCLAIAQANAESLGLTENVTFYESDLFDRLPQRKYDLIVSNPPYVAKDEWSELPKEYHREPDHGLIAGDDGLELVLKIMQEAPRFLSHNGSLVCEVGNAEAALIERFPDAPFLWLEFEEGGSGVFLLHREDLLSLKRG